MARRRRPLRGLRAAGPGQLSRPAARLPERRGDLPRPLPAAGDAGALEYVRALPKNHFAAFACPMLFEYATGNLYYGTELPVWGFAMVGGIRKAGAALLKP